MGIGLPVDGEGWCRMEMGDDGSPHGVSTFSDAARVKPGSDWMPVPPMTAMWTGAADGQDASCAEGQRRRRTVVRGSDAGHFAVGDADGAFRGAWHEMGRGNTSGAGQHSRTGSCCFAARLPILSA
jgi:hypothetical protein